MNDSIKRAWTAEELREHWSGLSWDTGEDMELATFLAQCTRLWAQCDQIEREGEGDWGVDDYAGNLEDVRKTLNTMRDGGQDDDRE